MGIDAINPAGAFQYVDDTAAVDHTPESAPPLAQAPTSSAPATEAPKLAALSDTLNADAQVNMTQLLAATASAAKRAQANGDSLWFEKGLPANDPSDPTYVHAQASLQTALSLVDFNKPLGVEMRQQFFTLVLGMGLMNEKNLDSLNGFLDKMVGTIGRDSDANPSAIATLPPSAPMVSSPASSVGLGAGTGIQTFKSSESDAVRGDTKVDQLGATTAPVTAANVNGIKKGIDALFEDALHGDLELGLSGLDAFRNPAAAAPQGAGARPAST